MVRCVQAYHGYPLSRFVGQHNETKLNQHENERQEQEEAEILHSSLYQRR